MRIAFSTKWRAAAASDPNCLMTIFRCFRLVFCLNKAIWSMSFDSVTESNKALSGTSIPWFCWSGSLSLIVVTESMAIISAGLSSNSRLYSAINVSNRDFSAVGIRIVVVWYRAFRPAPSRFPPLMGSPLIL